jgi:hypothetical protein
MVSCWHWKKRRGTQFLQTTPSLRYTECSDFRRSIRASEYLRLGVMRIDAQYCNG